MKYETRLLIDKANELLAIWQEQEKTSERVWDEQSAAHDAFVELAACSTSTAEEIHAAYKKFRALSDHARAVPTCYDVQREWALATKKALLALAEDFNLLRSEEEKSWDDAKENAVQQLAEKSNASATTEAKIVVDVDLQDGDKILLTNQNEAVGNGLRIIRLEKPDAK